MIKLIIFGKQVDVEAKKSRKDTVEFKDDKVVVKSSKAASTLLRDFLVELLHSELSKIYEDIRNDGKVELFGSMDFEVAEKIDKRKERIAKIKGNKILVKMSAIALPREALRYMLVHELAHIATKRHTKKFWKIVQTMYPSFKEGEKQFAEYRSLLVEPLDLKIEKLPFVCSGFQEDGIWCDEPA